MSPASAALLAATWSWGAGVAGFLLLGLLLPLAVYVLEATLLLWLQRRDWRLVLGGVGIVGVLLVTGAVALLGVRPPAPGRDYWIALSVEAGCMVLVAGTMQVLVHARRRAVADRAAMALLREPQREEPLRDALPRPRPVLRLNAVTAEHLAAEWMRHLGALDARVTPAGPDGGVDVRAARYVAQVKHRSDLVPVHHVRDLAGVAAVEGRTALFFTTGNYSSQCLAFAREAGVALFVLRFREGQLKAANPLARQLLQSGLAAAAEPAERPDLRLVPAD